MKFKQFDKVIIKHTNEQGYIDAVVKYRCLVILKDGCKWVDEWNLQFQEENMKITVEKSDDIKRMLGDI